MKFLLINAGSLCLLNGWKWIVANELNEKYCEWVSDKMANKISFHNNWQIKLWKFLCTVFIPWCYTEILSNCDAQPWWWDKFQWGSFFEVLGLVQDLSNCNFLLACHWVWLSRVWLCFLYTWRRLHQVFIDVDKILWALSLSDKTVPQYSLSPPHMTGLQSLNIFVPFTGLTPLCLCLCAGDTFPDAAWKMLLTFFTARAHGWLIVNF